MNEIINFLKEIIPLQQEKNNKKIWISGHCPFCKNISSTNRLFRLNTKLKVGKSYCCGIGFKELHFLKQLIENKDFKYIFELENGHGISSIRTKEHREIILKKYYEDKVRFREMSFEKFEGDDIDLPF